MAGGIFITTTRYHNVIDWWQAAPLHTKDAASWAAVLRSERVAFRALTIGIFFTAWMAIALRAGQSDPVLHKRLFFLATAVPLSAATSRISWLPNTLEFSTLSADIYTRATDGPLFAWDTFRNRRIHRAYVIWLVLFVLAEIMVNVISNTAWWQESIRAVMGGPAS